MSQANILPMMAMPLPASTFQGPVPHPCGPSQGHRPPLDRQAGTGGRPQRCRKGTTVSCAGCNASVQGEAGGRSGEVARRCNTGARRQEACNTPTSSCARSPTQHNTCNNHTCNAHTCAGACRLHNGVDPRRTLKHPGERQLWLDEDLASSDACDLSTLFEAHGSLHMLC